MAELADIRIILVEPAGARNVGSVARVMKNMGLANLILVSPLCDPQDPEARLMAVHGDDVLDQAQVVSSLPDALVGCQRVVGTTGRIHDYPAEWIIEDPRQGLAWVSQGGSAAIVFGPEDRGLSNGELAYCQRQVMIPTDPVYPSLNLAQAVGICCYELRIVDQAVLPVSSRDPLAPSEILEGFYQQLESLLLQIGYLHPQTATRKLSKFRALFNRAGLTLPEVALLRGILRQMGWAKQQSDPGRTPET